MTWVLAKPFVQGYTLIVSDICVTFRNSATGDEAIVVSFSPWIFENQTVIVTSLLYRLAEKLDEAIEEPKPLTRLLSLTDLLGE